MIFKYHNSPDRTVRDGLNIILIQIYFFKKIYLL